MEAALYYNLPETRADKPAGYPSTAGTKVAKVGGGTAEAVIGPGKLLKVMAGDKIHLTATSWWQSSATPVNSLSPLTPLIDLLLAAIPGGSSGKVGVGDLTEGMLTTPITYFLNGRNANTPVKPKAYVNWILFNDHMQYIPEGSGAVVVGNSGVLTTHVRNNIEVPKNGYIYVYVSNVSENIPVYFDNLQVAHERGPLLEETHYYPFGLVMSGISSKALNGAPENKRKWNKGSELESKEFSDGSGLEWYATPLRTLDPQIGRWYQIDSKPDYAQSLYSSMGNTPLLYNDPLGDTLRISFRTGFLGLGKRQEVVYNNGTLTNNDGSAYTGKVKGYLGKVVGALQSVNNTTEGSAMVSELQGSTNNFTIRNGSSNKFVASNSSRSFGMIPEVMATVGNGGTTITGGSGGTIYWNPSIGTSGMNAAGNINRPPFLGLGHEMAHARDANNGTLYPSNDYTNPINGASYQAMHLGLKKAEWRAVYMENLMRMQSRVPLRVNYGLSDDGETVSGTGPSTVQTLNFWGIPLMLPLNYQVR